MSNSPEISFIANHLPPLQDGRYTLNLIHTLKYSPSASNKSDSGSHTFNKTHTFFVCGERFSLRPDHIHKVFPPPNTQGDYDSVLPHVVLRRRTLPWERKPDQFDLNSPVQSWLAVMVFAQNEAPAVTTGTLADLYPSTAPDGGGTLPIGTYSYGSASAGQMVPRFLEVGETSSAGCVWFDLDPDTFGAFAPSLADLRWNAHARQRTHKDGSSDDYAVVVANRLPPAGQTVIAHLVSLEGLGDQLPNDDGSPPATCGAWTAIRLVSLKSWSFRVGPLQASFADVLKGLNSGVAESNETATQGMDCQLRLPGGYRPTASTAIASALPFDAGYTVLAGSAQSQAAWYRGPFVPSTVTPPPADSTWAANLLPADHATDLDLSVNATPATDRSYSAAWQIGRLIALADKDFATAQVAWKRDCRLKLNAAIRQGNTAPVGSRAAYARTVRGILADATKIQKYLGAELTTHQTSTTSLYIPQKLVDWLGKLALLNGVPFYYLVPDAAMLPPESIRFFNVDPRWIASLLDGAWSLGREPRDVWAFDTAYQPWSQLQAGTLLPTSPSGPTPWPVSGALLNSRLIPGYWPGIDFTLDSGTTLREDRLGPNTVLLLFHTTFSAMTIQEPPEGIHFGFDMDDTGDLSKPLRYVTIDNIYYPQSATTPAVGSDAEQCSLSPIPQRSRYVIQLSQLAHQMATRLGIPTATPNPFTAAEFALELVEGVPSVKFTLPPAS